MIRQVTESEKADKTLPQACLAMKQPTVIGKSEKPIIIIRGEPGYRELRSGDSMSLKTCVELNAFLCDCDPYQMTAMFVGATEGWSDPRAFASYWQNLGKD